MSDTCHAFSASIFFSEYPRARHDLQCCENTNWLPTSQPARVWPSSRSSALTLRSGLAWGPKPRVACSSTSGELANTVHQSPGVPVAVPGSATGSRSPKSRLYIDWTIGAVASERGICRSLGTAGDCIPNGQHCAGKARYDRRLLDRL